MIITSILLRGRERGRFLRFATVGVIGFVVDFATFNFFSVIVGIGTVLASVFSFIAAILSNFTWNRFWTYPDSRTKRIPFQLTQFAIVSVIGLMIRTPIIALLVRPLRLLFATLPFIPISFVNAELLGNNTALVIAVLVVMFWNFFVNRYWTYGDVQ